MRDPKAKTAAGKTTVKTAIATVVACCLIIESLGSHWHEVITEKPDSFKFEDRFSRQVKGSISRIIQNAVSE